MVNPKFGVASISCLNFILHKRQYSERVDCNPLLRSTRSEYWRFCILKFQHKMDAMPSFGVTMLSEMLSNPGSTLAEFKKKLINSFQLELEEGSSMQYGFHKFLFYCYFSVVYYFWLLNVVRLVQVKANILEKYQFGTNPGFT